MLPHKVEDGREDNIGDDDKESRLDHGGGGGAADGIGPSADAESLEAAHVDDDGGERQKAGGICPKR